MSRESLMAQQRARMEARRKRLSIQKKEQESKTKAKTKDYTSGNRKAVTRNTSKDTPVAKKEKNVGPTIIRNGKLHRWNGSKYVVDTKGGLSTQARRKVSSTSPTTPSKTNTTKKAPVPAGKVPAPAKPSTPTAKPSKSKAKPNGGGPTKTDDGTSRRSPSYAGVLPGTPEKKKEKKPTTRRSSRRGAAARTNRAKSTPTTATGSEKQIKVGKQTVTMVYNGSKWVRKK